MDLPAILNVAIGLVLLYFLLSTLCSTVVELLSAFVQFREEILYVTINHLLDDTENADRPWSLWRLLRDRLSNVTLLGRQPLRRFRPTPLPGDEPDPGSIAEKFWQHAKIKSATQPGRDAPASLDAPTFAAVLIDVALERDSVGELPTTRVALERRLQPAPGSILSSRLRRNLLTLGLSSEIPLGASGEVLWAPFRKNLGRWYDEAMARATECYRRRMMLWLLSFGLVAAALFNADTLRVAFLLARDPAQAQRMVDYADQIVKAHEEEEKAKLTTEARPPAAARPAPPAANGATAPSATPAEASTTTAGDATTTPASPTGPYASERERVAASLDQLRLLEAQQFPIGWHFDLGTDWLIFGVEPPPQQVVWLSFWWWRTLVVKLLGLCLTAVAVAQGGPFWYDLLKKLLGLRKGGAADAPASAPASSAASPVSGQTPADAAATKEMIPLEPGRDLARATTGVDFRKAYWLARAAELAYAEPAAIQQLLRTDWRFHCCECFSQTGPVSLGAGSSTVTITVDTQVFVAADDQVILVAFRGTEPHKLDDIVTDLRLRWTQPSDAPIPRRVHRGFHAGLAAVFDRVSERVTTLATQPLLCNQGGPGDPVRATPLAPPQRHLYLTGHSLGGALATLCLARLREPGADGKPRYTGPASLYTYGCPLVGDQAFADEVETAGRQQLFRFVHGADVVPLVPPEALALGGARYCHAGEMFHLTSDGKLARQVSSFNRWLGQAAAAVRDLRSAGAQAVGDHGMHHYVARTHALALSAPVI